MHNFKNRKRFSLYLYRVFNPFLPPLCCHAGWHRTSSPHPCFHLCTPQSSLHLQPEGFCQSLSDHASPLLRTFQWLHSSYRHQVPLGLAPVVWLMSLHTPPSHALCLNPINFLTVPQTHQPWFYHVASAPLFPLPGTLLLTYLLGGFTPVLCGVSLTSIPPHSPSPVSAFYTGPGFCHLAQYDSYFSILSTSLFYLFQCLSPALLSDQTEIDEG